MRRTVSGIALAVLALLTVAGLSGCGDPGGGGGGGYVAVGQAQPGGS